MSITSSPLKSVLSPVTVSVFGNTLTQQVLALSPQALYDFSDISSLYQDSAGTTAVTGVGDPVGLVLDKTGNANNLSNTTASQRPLYQADGSLLFDGVDDNIGFDFSGTSHSFFFAVKTTDNIGVLLSELGFDAAGMFHDVGTDGYAQGFLFDDILVDGVAISDDRAALHGALSDGNWHSIEIKNADVSTYTRLFILSNWTGTWRFSGNLGPRFAAFDTSTANTNQSLIGRWVVEGLS
jgi:hypothetical protein